MRLVSNSLEKKMFSLFYIQTHSFIFWSKKEELPNNMLVLFSLGETAVQFFQRLNLILQLFKYNI